MESVFLGIILLLAGGAVFINFLKIFKGEKGCGCSGSCGSSCPKTGQKTGCGTLER